ncbi:hypothetical protein D3C81_844140 [compost metagenome]
MRADLARARRQRAHQHRQRAAHGRRWQDHQHERQGPGQQPDAAFQPCERRSGASKRQRGANGQHQHGDFEPRIQPQRPRMAVGHAPEQPAAECEPGKKCAHGGGDGVHIHANHKRELLDPENLVDQSGRARDEKQQGRCPHGAIMRRLTLPWLQGGAFRTPRFVGSVSRLLLAGICAGMRFSHGAILVKRLAGRIRPTIATGITSRPPPPCRGTSSTPRSSGQW